MNMEQSTPKGNFPVAALASGEPLTMSSREIAELVESRHDKVKQSMERLAERGIITFTPMGEKSSGGRPGTIYRVNKRDSFVVVAQLCPEFTARLVDRWQELEQEKANGGFALPQTYEQALEGLLAKVRENGALQIENRAKDAAITAMQPKVDAYEAYLSEEGVCRITDFCNKHGVKVNRPGWILRDRGLMHHKKVLATQIGLKSGVLKNVLEKDGFEYIDSKGQSVEAQQAMIVRQREVSLLKMIVDAYGLTAFRNSVAFDRAKALIGSGK
ncbi:Rha family transcriptional regulator [Paracoccus denitrificans]|uniref:Rha family transcriptional regulator n=1 Tax=Paracoccus denitrificans TaxID=266 RepID=UPI001E361BC1|nr:Rha family transcriptional regulator [Paracoccus denitrificans]UFS67754.1 Rha family transcriptional regulator [Paracoccus denitrificans]